MVGLRKRIETRSVPLDDVLLTKPEIDFRSARLAWVATSLSTIRRRRTSSVIERAAAAGLSVDELVDHGWTARSAAGVVRDS